MLNTTGVPSVYNRNVSILTKKVKIMNKTEIGILNAYHEALAFINVCADNFDQKLLAKTRQIEYYEIGRHTGLNLPTYTRLNELGCNY